MTKTGVPKLNLSEDSPDEADQAQGKVSKAPAARKTAVARPATLKLIIDAIIQQKEKKGSTVQEIKKYIEGSHGYQPSNVVLKKAFAKGLKDKVIVRADGKDTASLTARYLEPKKVLKPKEVKEHKGIKATESTANKMEKPTGKTKSGDKEEKAAKKSKKADPKETSSKVPKKARMAVAPLKVEAGKKASGKSKAGQKGPVQSASDAEAAERPKMVNPSTHRRRSKSESAVSAKSPPKRGKAAPKLNSKAVQGGKRALRV